MDVQINTWGVLLAAVASMGVGAVWYSMSVFGKTWSKLARVDMSRKGKAVRDAFIRAMSLTFLLSLLTAYILAHVTYLSFSFFDVSYMSAALTTAFWLWLGLTFARIATHDLFEGRPLKLTMITMGNEFLTLMAMGLFIGWVGL